jgi:hypothetical protein
MGHYRMKKKQQFESAGDSAGGEEKLARIAGRHS